MGTMLASLLGLVRAVGRFAKRLYRYVHKQVIERVHRLLHQRLKLYRKWHGWRQHEEVHYAVLAVFIFVVGALVLQGYRRVNASDVVEQWQFSSSALYEFDSGIEIHNATARLRALNYTTDDDTGALYHFDEIAGSTVSDNSGNGNDGDVNGAAFATGLLDNALDLDGVNDSVTVPDSESVSLAQQNTLEAWTKLDNDFAAGASNNRLGIIDKGEYQLYYDNETGKITYELADDDASTWDQVAGNDLRSSWDLDGKSIIRSQAIAGTDVYVGLGLGVGDAEVWKYSGGVWTMVGGDGINSSWNDQLFEEVDALVISGSYLYAGLGLTAGDAEVWRCNITTNCTSWSKVGGDGANSSWAVGTYEAVYTMDLIGTTLYAGLGASANDAEVWSCNTATNCTSWTKIGGDSLNSGWAANFETVRVLTNDGTNLYAGLGDTAADAEVWKWNGSTWSLIGGDGASSSWSTNYEQVLSLNVLNGDLYAGLGNTAGDSEVWRLSGGTWSQIGGDGLNSSWAAGTYEGTYSLVNDGTNLYAGQGSGNGDGELWMWNGSTWSKTAGDGVNGSWSTNFGDIVWALTYANSTLYAGLYDSAGDGRLYALQDSTWTQLGGGYVNRSWGFYGPASVRVLSSGQGYLYGGLSGVTGSAQVWRYNGSSWSIIGGQGLNNSWDPYVYESVISMTSYNGQLYVGLGTTASDADVWRWNGTSWQQVGGDGLNSSWGANYEEVSAMVSYGGYLYAGIGISNSEGEVYRWDGTSWTKIGGDGINSGWPLNYDRVSSLAVYNGEIIAGLGGAAGEGEAWKWNGSSWAKIGGDGLNNGWDATIEHIYAMTSYNGKLYAGLGLTTDDAEVWEWDGSSWTKVGGDDVNSSWTGGTYEVVSTLSTYNGNLFVGIGNTAGDGEVWRLASNGSWSKVAGNNLNSGWGNLIEEVQALNSYKGKLYAGIGNTANADAAVWSYGNNGYLQSDTASFNTDWRHIAATYNGTTMRLYINGELDSSTNVSISMPDSGKDLLIGQSYGGREQGKAQGYFAGLIDEVRISSTARTSFTTKPYADTAQTIHPKDAEGKQGIWHWDSFAADEAANGGTITYRLSADGGTNWLYWDGDEWAASTSAAQANTASDINNNMADFPVTFDGLIWQAVLDGDGSQQVTLNSVNTEATSDLLVPSTDASNITALKVAGGDPLGAGGWTSRPDPVFSWDPATDDESGIKGYCLYLGTDASADPVASKGLLGTSPVGTGGHCQFIVDSPTVDLATSGYIATPLTTSNSSYYFIIKAIDNAGNISENAESFAFKFDNTPPSNPSFITAPSGFINTKQVTMSWPTSGSGIPSDDHSGIAGLQYRIGSGGTWYGDDHTGSQDNEDLLAHDGSYTTVEIPDYASLNDGNNIVYFRTWDQAGNISTGTVTSVIKINTTAPTSPRNVEADPETNTVNSFAFSWDAPESFGGSASAIAYCYTINTLPTINNCTFTDPGETSLAAGAYATQPGENTFYVVAKDEAGNINFATAASTTFTANTAAPGVPINVDVADISVKATGNWKLALSWEEPEETGAGVASYKVYRSTNGSSFTQTASTAGTSYVDDGLSEVTYYYKIKACDSANNCGAFSSEVSKLPTGKFTTPAEIVDEPTASSIGTRKATINWVTDRDSDSRVQYGLKSGQYFDTEAAISDQEKVHTVSLEGLTAGTTYFYRAKWTDEDGNTGTSAEKTFTTLPPPVVKNVKAEDVELSSATIRFTSKDATKVNIKYGKSEGFGGLETINTSTSESSYSLELSGLDDGTRYFYTFELLDGDGNNYDSGVVFNFTTPPRPRIENLRFQPVDGVPTSTQRVTWTTNVPASSEVQYSRVGGRHEESSSSKLTRKHSITIKNLLDDTQYRLVAMSRDADGNQAISDEQTFHTELDTRPPEISAVAVETDLRGTGGEARGQLIISWQTDEPAMSQVEYGDGSVGGAFTSRTAEQSEMTTEHLVIVSDLPPSKVYHFRPLSRDKASNAGIGTDTAAIIGRPSESVLDIILTSLERIFGL